MLALTVGEACREAALGQMAPVDTEPPREPQWGHFSAPTCLQSTPGKTQKELRDLTLPPPQHTLKGSDRGSLSASLSQTQASAYLAGERL